MTLLAKKIINASQAEQLVGLKSGVLLFSAQLRALKQSDASEIRTEVVETKLEHTEEQLRALQLSILGITQQPNVNVEVIQEGETTFLIATIN